MKRKSNARKVADAAARKVLRARILRVLTKAGYMITSEMIPVIDMSTSRRVAALLRELLDT